jgi:hypothetical protein
MVAILRFGLRVTTFPERRLCGVCSIGGIFEPFLQARGKRLPRSHVAPLNFYHVSGETRLKLDAFFHVNHLATGDMRLTQEFFESAMRIE